MSMTISYQLQGCDTTHPWKLATTGLVNNPYISHSYQMQIADDDKELTAFGETADTTDSTTK
ncbi:hypothetical protein MJO29_005490 [Puccinia striiformis f. sp. tritici]|nr:hypothetical protein MJO29_005490 [Puccinia striiformis f. sp. tritici]